jgi:phage terminase small subunit
LVQTGRKPFTTIDITPFGLPDGRLRPPASLGQLEKQAFLDLISRVPAGQFRESDLPLLCRWCEASVMAEQAAGELAAGGMVVDGRVSPWFGIHERATKSLVALALRLRLSPQARADKAPKALPGPVSYYDLKALENGGDDDDKVEPS